MGFTHRSTPSAPLETIIINEFMVIGRLYSLMAVNLNAMARAFLDSSPTLAQASKKEELQAGTWYGDHEIPVVEIAKKLQKIQGLNTNAGIRLPLHEPDSADLTGEYLLAKSKGHRLIYHYYDTERERNNRIYHDSLKRARFGWQMRFWHPDYEPSEPPEFQQLSEEEQAIIDAIPAHLTPSLYAQAEADALYNHLRDFVSTQKSNSRAENREEYELLDQGDYRRKHGGVHIATPTVVSGEGSAASWYVTIPDDSDERDEDEFISVTTGLWQGNDVIIDTPPWETSPDSFPLTARITNVDDHGITFIVDDEPENSLGAISQLQSYFDSDSSDVSMYPLFNPVPFDRELAAIRTVRKTQVKREVVTGNTGIRFDADRALHPKFSSLNPSQKLAACQAVAAEQMALIHGPPGTGKTRTLTELIKYFASRGLRVLACAHSNQATDNLLVGGSTIEEPDPSSLHAAVQDDEFKMARVGINSEHPVVRAYYAESDVGGADVVGATMSAAAEFDKNSFDVAVVDEASQASIPATFAPLVAAKRIILAGDHKQLPPYGSQEMQEREMEVSLFEHIINRFGADCAQMLTTQYRMHSQIASFPSKQFYDGEVSTHDADHGYKLFDYPPITAHHVVGTERQVHGKSYANDAEAAIVAEHVADLRESGVPQSEIGVITAYTGQIKVIRNHLNRLDVSTSDLAVDTVDSFQGGERTAIIVSFVRSNDAGRSGFLSLPDEGPRRLNVAITRPKRRLILIGDWDTLCREEPSSRADCTDLYREYRSWLLDHECFQPTPERSSERSELV